MQQITLNEKEFQRTRVRLSQGTANRTMCIAPTTIGTPRALITNRPRLLENRHPRLVVGKAEELPRYSAGEAIRRLQAKEPNTWTAAISMHIGADIRLRKRMQPRH